METEAGITKPPDLPLGYATNSVLSMSNNTPSTLENLELPLETFMLSIPVQHPNAFIPISETEAGIVISVSFIQAQNAPSPIDVTEFGISTLVNPVQFSKASTCCDI